jgi:hypothetical protein
MKVIGITSAAILALLLGITAPAFAQHEQGADKQDHVREQGGGHEQGRPEPQHAQQQRQPEHAQQQQHAQPQQQVQRNQQQHAQQQQQVERDQQQHAQQQQAQRNQQQQVQRNQQQHAQQQQQARNRQQPQRSQHQQQVRQSAWQQHRSQNWQADHRTWQQRGGYHGYRIPDDRYRGYFGPSHGFRINTLPFLVVGGYPRFQYQGYWISAIDPWPDSWGNDWYDNDDVYVDYVDNGYYLYNRRYPSSGIAINITL